MKIDNKFVVIYYTAVYQNIFCCTFYNTETKQIKKIAFAKNENIKENIKLLQQIFNYPSYLFCGYGNNNFDDIIINYILSTKKYWIREEDNDIYYQDACLNCMYIKRLILENKDLDQINKYKFKKIFNSFDLKAMIMKKGFSPSISELATNLCCQKQPFINADETSISEVQESVENIIYIINDLLNHVQDKISIRLQMLKLYDYDILSTNDVGIGKKVLRFMYLNKTGMKWDEIKDLRTTTNDIYLKDIIHQDIHFETPNFQVILETLKNIYFPISGPKWNKSIWYGGANISLTIGGLHSIQEPEIISLEESEKMISIDVESLYPSLVVNYSFYPKHLQKEFLEIYEKLFKERLIAKHNNDDIRNKTLKIILNSTIGLYKNSYSWLYDQESYYKVRVNGQLLMMMLLEQLVGSFECKICNLNTDGIIFIIKDKYLSEYNNLIKSFSEKYNLSFKEEVYKKLYQYSLNDYFIINENDEIKKKGLFSDEISYDRSASNLIVGKAVIDYYVNKIPVETTTNKNLDHMSKANKIINQMSNKQLTLFEL